MTTKNMLTAAVVIGAAAATAFYLIGRKKRKKNSKAFKAGVRKATHHLTDIFHNAKEASYQKMAGA